jgi:flagellar hook-length control protein FliK
MQNLASLIGESGAGAARAGRTTNSKTRAAASAGALNHTGESEGCKGEAPASAGGPLELRADKKTARTPARTARGGDTATPAACLADSGKNSPQRTAKKKAGGQDPVVAAAPALTGAAGAAPKTSFAALMDRMARGTTARGQVAAAPTAAGSAAAVLPVATKAAPAAKAAPATKAAPAPQAAAKPAPSVMARQVKADWQGGVPLRPAGAVPATNGQQAASPLASGAPAAVTGNAPAGANTAAPVVAAGARAVQSAPTSQDPAVPQIYKAPVRGGQQATAVQVSPSGAAVAGDKAVARRPNDGTNGSELPNSVNRAATSTPEARTVIPAALAQTPVTLTLTAQTTAPVPGDGRQVRPQASRRTYASAASGSDGVASSAGRRADRFTANSGAAAAGKSQRPDGLRAATARAVEAGVVRSTGPQATGAEAQGVAAGPVGPAAIGSSDIVGGQAPTAPQTRGEAPTPVVDQVLAAVQASGTRRSQQVVVRLSPPELGNVRVTLRAAGGSLRGVLEADNPQTAKRLEHEAAALAQRLEDCGVQVRRLDVVLHRQDGGQSSDQARQDGGGRQWQEPADGRGGQAPADAGLARLGEQVRAETSSDAGVPGLAGTINVRI